MSTDQSSNKLGQSVGAKIRAMRQAKKYTQSQLALPDFSVSYISAIERGQIQNQFPARAQNAMRFVRGQGVIDAGIDPDVERENDVELIGGERQVMDAGLEKTRARVSALIDG